MQGVLPLLAGAGAEIRSAGKWTGGGQAVRNVLGLYAQVYGQGLGDPKLQQEAKGRDKSFEEFADGRIGILGEGDYFWRDVINPKTGVAKMGTRNQDVGYAMFPAMAPGKGIRGQSFVSMSGGAVTVLNPNTKYPQQAFELLAFMNSPAMTKARTAGTPEITSRTDVNKQILAGDPFLTFVADRILPITAYRPGVAAYPEVSVALQEATAAVVAGKSPEEAAARYGKKLEGIVGGAANVAPADEGPAVGASPGASPGAPRPPPRGPPRVPRRFRRLRMTSGRGRVPPAQGLRVRFRRARWESWPGRRRSGACAGTTPRDSDAEGPPRSWRPRSS
ncbi:extracellular solute-binding protein [Actinomadura yumaensis]|uniref:extracellular solute-binding protein n=1 Tax=Actinomadura yumaensis TaxID=111807 RepID=UPI00360B3B19